MIPGAGSLRDGSWAPGEGTGTAPVPNEEEYDGMADAFELAEPVSMVDSQAIPAAHLLGTGKKIDEFLIYRTTSQPKQATLKVSQVSQSMPVVVLKGQ